MAYEIERSAYADMFGPTTGDRVRVELSPYDLTRGRITYRLG